MVGGGSAGGKMRNDGKVGKRGRELRSKIHLKDFFLIDPQSRSRASAQAHEV